MDQGLCSPVPCRSPDDGELDRADADLAADRHGAALQRGRTVLARWPDHPRALALLGRVALHRDQPDAALEPLRRAVALEPRLDVRIWLALSLDGVGRRREALLQIEEAVASMPPTPAANFAVAMLLERLGRPADAVRHYAACLALDPDRADAHHRHGRALQATGDIAGAIASYRRAIRLRETGTEAAKVLSDLSSGLACLGRFDEAHARALAAIGLDPDCAEAQNNAGHALLNLDRSAEAVAFYDAALAVRADYPTARFGRAVALLKSGDFARGWAEYEWRWRDCQRPRPDLAAAAWTGEALGGRTILLHAEQGFGDTLQFVRFAPMVAARGGRVVLEVPRPLVRLLRAVDGVAEVVACGDPLPPFDLHCPMASLPLRVGLSIDGIPAAPYLAGPVPRRPAAAAHGLTVGLVWAGDPRPAALRSNLIDRRRSTTPATLAPLLDLAGVRFVSFQVGAAPGELEPHGLADAVAGVADFADTAARLAGIDLLITVDTAMAHLAGGLGLPVWMLSRHDGCWRWLERRADTPWYPTMRIFRQPAPGDWSAVIAEVRIALQSAARAGSGLPHLEPLKSVSKGSALGGIEP